MKRYFPTSLELFLGLLAVAILWGFARWTFAVWSFVPLLMRVGTVIALVMVAVAAGYWLAARVRAYRRRVVR